MQGKIRQLFRVQTDEVSQVALLWTQSFCIGLAVVLYESAATAVFLGAFDVSSLPLVYIGVAVVGVGFGCCYLRLEKRLNHAQLFRLTAFLVLGGLVAIRILLAGSGAQWVFLAAMIWVDVTVVFMGLIFWQQVELLLSVRQGKRLFGIIGSGEVVGVVLGGLSVPLAVRSLGLLNLIVVSAVAVGVFIFLQGRSAARVDADSGADEATPGSPDYPVREMFRNGYILMIFTFSLLAVLSDYFVDFIFFTKVEQEFPEQEELAAFLGPFFAVVGILALVARLFLFTRVMQRFGIRGGLIALPLAVGGALVLTLFAHYTFPQTIGGAGSGWIFGLVLLTKLFDLGLRPAVLEPTQMLLYQPLALPRRRRVHSFNDTVVEPVCNGIAGFLLLAMSGLLHWQLFELVAVTLVVVVVMAVCCLVVGRGYSKQMVSSFGSRQLLDRSTGAHNDLESLRVYLDSPNPAEVVYVLRLLAGNGKAETVEEDLLRALDYDAVAVRVEALHVLADHGGPRAVDRIADLVNRKECDDKTMAAAIKAVCALQAHDAVPLVSPFLNSSTYVVKQAALLGLVRNGGIGGVLVAGGKLTEEFSSKDASVRRSAAHLLGEIGIPSFHQPLIALLADSDASVRRSAARAAGKLGEGRLVPYLIGMLSDPELECEAIRALAKCGRNDEAELARQFELLPVNCYERVCLVEAAASQSGPEASAFLCRIVAAGNLDERQVAAEGLASQRYEPSAAERKMLAGRITHELELVADIHLEQHHCHELPFMSHMLTAEAEGGVRRALNLISLLTERDTILRVRGLFGVGHGVHHAHGVEILDNVLQYELRKQVLAAVESTRNFIQARDPALALVRIALRSSGDVSVITKTASLWTLFQLAPEKGPPTVLQLTGQPVAILDELLCYRTEPQTSRSRNDLIIARTEALTRVSFLTLTPTHELVELARLVRPRELIIGEILFKEGDPGSSLYIIAEGRLSNKLTTGKVEYYGPGSVIGELAALDPEPRLSTVGSVAPSVVLELDGGRLLEFMAHRPMIARAIFRFLCQRVRNSVHARDLPADIHVDSGSFEAESGLRETGYLMLERCQALAGIAMFQNVSESTIEGIASRLAVKYAGRDRVVIREGEVGESMFILVRGRMRVEQGGSPQSELEAGAVFGQLAALTAEPRAATIIAAEESTLFQISGELIYDLISESPELVVGITKVLCQDLRLMIRGILPPPSGVKPDATPEG
jgi:AAA family ATP:ADP antiporter